jgi:CHAT domain-containing protein
MTRRRWIGLIFLVVVAVSAVSLWRVQSDPMRRLVRATSREGRPVEARLIGGFRWAPIERRTVRGAATDEPGVQRSMQMASAQWWVLSKTINDSSPGGRHVAAVAMLLQGSSRNAATRLAQLTAEGPADAGIWSDLAAARYEVGLVENDPSMLGEALVAADASLRINPALREALFNRALALERLGFRDFAREAWERFLVADGASPWADEARQHLLSLTPVPVFQEVLDKNFDLLVNDRDFAYSVARTRPWECRLYGETAILGNWALAETKGDQAFAERHLRIARSFGEELARNRGEAMLQGAVRAIDRADAEARKHLTTGHILFRQAQTEFKNDRVATAQPIFEDAAKELEAGGSPIALIARFYLAHTYFMLGNLAEARRREQRLLDEAPPELRAHRAQLLWHLGLGYQAEGNWGRAMATLKEAAAIFEAIGESDSAANMREMIAEVYDRTGDPQAAWAERLIALRGIGRMTASRLQLSLDAMARGAMMRKQWPMALSFLDLAGEAARRIKRPATEVDTRLLQAHVFRRMDDGAGADEALRRAAAAAAKIEDAASRENAGADVMATEAILTPSPDVAVALLSKAIEYHQTRGRRMLLPDMYLRRGRAFRELRLPGRAAADMEVGIVEVEQHRASLPSGEPRWGVFHAAEELFEEAIGLALVRHDVNQAFAYAERARARELLEALGGSAPAFMPSMLDANVVIIEYVVLPVRLVLFTVSGGEIHVSEQQVDRAALEHDVEDFIKAASADSYDVRQLSRMLYRRLIVPAESSLTGHETIVFVPGRSLSVFPFAALMKESGEYLVQRHAVVVAPSASVFAQLAAHNRPATADRRVLVVANPTPLEQEDVPLPGAQQEAEEVAAMYPRATRLTGERATIAEFRRNAPEADVIHLATHGAVTAPGRRSAALLFSGGLLDARAIAGISLPHTAAVVLAACDSARGPERAEGTISVARSFLAAGVPAVAATLWKIDDMASARFFPRVHARLARGLSLREALREAQIESIQQGEMPSIWAAVQCIGN